MKIKQLLFLGCLISFPFTNYSQQWHQYSDSIISNINKNDLEKAAYFVDLTDAEMKGLKVIKDTVYADYLYRKDILNYLQAKKCSDLLSESLAIWDASNKRNYFKIMKIHYFLGKNYISEENYELAISSFEKCYEINKKYKLKENANFNEALYLLAALYDNKGNRIKAGKYADEYIALMQSTAYEYYDFRFANAFEFKKDIKRQESVLLQFLTNYDKNKLNNSNLLFKINYELFLFYSSNEKFSESIKYGEKAFEIQQKEHLEVNDELEEIFSDLIYNYEKIGDNINSVKFEKLKNTYFPETQENDYYSVLTRFINTEDFITFKTKFDEYESVFISKRNYDDLVMIYDFVQLLFERNILFSKDDLANRLQFLNENRASLSEEYKVLLDFFNLKYYIMTNNFSEALKICNNNLNTKNIKIKLEFYRSKAICELSLANGDAKKTAYKTLDIANNNYEEYDPRLLPYLSLILTVDVMGQDINTTRVATKTLRILYDNKLEKTDVAVGVWLSLGQVAYNKKNLKDSRVYYENALRILESTNVISNPFYYYSGLLQMASIELLEKNYDKSLEYSNKVKLFLDKNPQMIQIAYADYYYQLGDFYFFQDKFIEAKKNYEKSFAIYGETISNIRKLNYILCDYFINDDVDKTIQSLVQYQKENNGIQVGAKTIYLLKFNSGDLIGSRKLLVSQLETLISNNNQYFHLLSDYEKQILYKGFSDQFEFLNTHLLSNDPSFLKDYINFRFYSKSLLFSNSFKVDDKNDENKELYSELKNNTLLINKATENKVVDLKEIEDLKMRNREIEKFLSFKNTSLTVPTIKDLNLKLKVNEAYIEIIRINKQYRSASKKGFDVVNQFTDSIYYGAIVIKKNTAPKFILIDDSNQLESQYIVDFKNKIANKQEDKESYRLLFEKIDNELKDVEKVYLATDGDYNSINVESIYNPDKKQFVIDYLKIQQIQNVRTITDEKKEFKISSTSKASLFGNPDFDLAITNDNNKEFSLERNLDSNLLDEIKSDVTVSRLRGTEKEIETITSILNEGQCSVKMYSLTTATEDNLKKVQSPDILHLATHGYFLKNDDTSKTKQSISELINENYEDNPFLKSGLLLAGAQNTLNGKQTENTNNGILTAEEAKSLDLIDTELVILSACETGLGDNLVGEGVIGLQRAFMIAGAKSVIMSLWSVSDEKTQALMTLFYTNWIKNNMSKKDAFYKAKIEMKKLYPQPYYWAGFILLE